MNPHFRALPSELLKNELFDKIRKPDQEKGAP
jgi:hypothetical protein